MADEQDGKRFGEDADHFPMIVPGEKRRATWVRCFERFDKWQQLTGFLVFAIKLLNLIWQNPNENWSSRGVEDKPPQRPNFPRIRNLTSVITWISASKSAQSASTYHCIKYGHCFEKESAKRRTDRQSCRRSVRSDCGD